MVLICLLVKLAMTLPYEAIGISKPIQMNNVATQGAAIYISTNEIPKRVRFIMSLLTIGQSNGSKVKVAR